VPSVPPNIQAAVHPFARCPDSIWQATAYLESGFNPFSVGDVGTSFGIFQLHRGGQADAAFRAIQRTTGLTGQAAEQYLMSHVELQAQYAMPAINAAWSSLGGSYNPTSITWWLNFCSQSGHPGGSPGNPVTQSMAAKYLALAKQNAFGLSGGVTGNQSTVAIDTTWLRILTTLPPHQPCNIVWRRTCPGGKAAFEGGMDLTSPNGTKVYALSDGEVRGAGYFVHPNGNDGHGVVTVRTSFPDGSVGDVYYQHIQISPNIILCGQTGGQLYAGVVGPPPTGQRIQRGQFIGTVVVGLVEVGINAEWGGIWGTNHPGPWIDDPEDLIRSLMDQGGGTPPRVPLTTGVDFLDNAIREMHTKQHTGLETLTKHPGLAGPLQQFHDAQQFVPFSVPSQPGGDTPVVGGIESGLTYPVRLFIGVISFLIQNTMPFFIRSSFSLLSLIVIVALIINITSKISSDENAEDDTEKEGRENEQPDTEV